MLFLVQDVIPPVEVVLDFLKQFRSVTFNFNLLDCITNFDSVDDLLVFLINHCAEYGVFAIQPRGGT